MCPPAPPPSPLDANQVLKGAYDDATGSLRTTATLSGTVTVELDAATDSVRVEDPDTGAHIRVETDGSINVNSVITATSGDNILIIGTEDGTTSGIQHVAKIGSDLNLRVKDEAIDAKLNTLGQKTMAGSVPVTIASDQPPIDTLQLNDLIPIEFNEIDVASKNSWGDPLIVNYKLASLTVATLNITYDSDGDLQNVVRT